jgi:hypothetical protein
MATQERRAPHPASCDGCIKADLYAIIIDGVARVHGHCRKYTNRGQWPDGCAEFVPRPLKDKRR